MNVLNISALRVLILMLFLVPFGTAAHIPEAPSEEREVMPEDPSPDHATPTTLSLSATFKKKPGVKLESTFERAALMEPFPDAVECPIAVPNPDWERLLDKAVRRRFNWGDIKAANCIVRAMFHAESAWRPKVCSPVGACGLGQLMPGTAEQLGVTDRFDPAQNIPASVQYLAWNTRQFSHAHDRTFEQQIHNGLASYNRGLGGILGWQRKYGCVNWLDCFVLYAPIETRDYVWRIETYRLSGRWMPHPPQNYILGKIRSFQEALELPSKLRL